MQLSHTPEPRRWCSTTRTWCRLLVWPDPALADQAGRRELADPHLTVPTDKGANAGLKVASLVAGMVAGADSIDEMAVPRHGGMVRLFDRIYAPSMLGSFLACVHLRAHPATRCGRVQVPARGVESSSRPEIDFS